MQLHGSELKKGVVIERGASPWQIFQQNEQGFAVIRLSGTAHRVRQSFELPLEFLRRTGGLDHRQGPHRAGKQRRERLPVDRLPDRGGRPLVGHV